VDTIVRQLATVSERDLLDATRRGDTDAFAALYDRYHPLVYRVANRMLADADAAEDIVQSVFISLWKTPPQFQSGSFAGWLACVTKNRVRDAMRARNARREATWPENLVAADSLHDQVYLRLEGMRVRSALAQLPEAQRSLIELGFFGDRTHAELAEITSLPLGTVKTRIRAGLQKLRFSLNASVAV
jgi:RNA polymerase sigma-70 factor (ECF subfamily)